MILTLCGSMKFAKQTFDISKKLEDLGHKALYATDLKFFIDDEGKKDREDNFTKNEITQEVKESWAKPMLDHFALIDNSDAILVLNFEKKGIKNYIGSSSFVEMYYAWGMGKTVYLLNDIPSQKDQNYIYDDLLTFDLIVLNNNLQGIKEADLKIITQISGQEFENLTPQIKNSTSFMKKRYDNLS